MDDEKLQEIIKDIRSLARWVDNYEPQRLSTNQKYRKAGEPGRSARCPPAVVSEHGDSFGMSSTPSAVRDISVTVSSPPPLEEHLPGCLCRRDLAIYSGGACG